MAHAAELPQHPLLRALLAELAFARPGAEAPALLVRSEPGAVVLAVGGGAQLLLLLPVAGPLPAAPELAARVEALLGAEPDGVVEGSTGAIVAAALGGEGDADAWLAGPEAGSALLGRRIDRLHVAADATVRGPPGEAQAVLAEAARRVRWGPAQAAGGTGPAPALDGARLAAAEAAGEQALAEEGLFVRAHGLRQSAASLSILAACTALWLCETLWGGATFDLTLLRMGANHRALEGGRALRLLSAGYLHNGFAHLASNAVLLLILGFQLEPALGAARTFVLFTAGVLAGNLATAVGRPQLIALGASGGLFALLAGAAALPFRRPDLVPRLSRRHLLGLSLSFLALNLIGSFTPGVDARAHLAGGAAGALLCGSGLLEAGRRRTWAGERERRAARLAWSGFGLAALAATVAALAAALAEGRPWRLGLPLSTPALVRTRLPGTPLSILLPLESASGAGRTEHGGWTEHAFGEAERDPLIALASARALGSPLSAAEEQEALESVRRDLSRPPAPPLALQAPPSLVRLGGRPAVFVDQLKQGEVRLPRWVFLRGQWMIDLEVSLAPGLPERWARLAPEIAASVEADVLSPPAGGEAPAPGGAAPAPDAAAASPEGR